MPLSVGERLGPYEILAPIGAGGMGEVYKARDTRLGRIVAVKVSQEKFSERFERETRAVAALNHPNICTLHDVGPNYLVMEYIEGASLKGPLPLDQALKYAAQICDALDAAHKKSITHRDLKPQNILVTKAGVKLLDFGLARIANADQTLTMAGEVMGTPAYMSPEQWEGKPGDARSDIYAFGCVLYEMLTGKRAAQERTLVKPAALESVLRTCLAKDPDDRWQSARDVKASLELVQVGRAILSPATISPWPERAAWMAVTVLLLVVALFFAMRPSGNPPDAYRVSLQVYPPDKLAFSGALNITVNVPHFALSPDGRTIVFVTAPKEGGRPVLWLRPLGEVAAQQLKGTEGAQDPFWKPDSRWIGFFAEGKLKKIPAAGGAVEEVVLAADPRGGAWGRDDTILFSNGTEPLHRVASTGGPVTPASTLAPQEGSHRYPQFLPDGRHFIYKISASGDQSGVYAGSLDDKTEKLLIRTNNSAVYAPPGYLLYVDGDTLLAQGFNAEGIEPSGQPFLVAAGVGRTTTFFSAVSASRTGTIAYAGTITQNGSLIWFDRGGKQPELAVPEGYYIDFRLSPTNDKLLAVSRVDPKSSAVDVWMWDLARNNSSKMTSGGAANASPTFSPDGTQLLYRTNGRGGSNEFHVRSAAGGGNDQLVLGLAAARAAQIQSGALIPTDWSRDSNILFSVPGTETGVDLWVLPLKGDKKPVKFWASASDELLGTFSPDGHMVAYTSNESGKYQVQVQTFPRSDKVWTVSEGYEPRWRPDNGGELYYLSEDRKLMMVSVGTGSSPFSVPKELFQTHVPAGITTTRTHYVPNHDGTRFLINTESGEAPPNPITVVLNWTAGSKK